MKTRFNKIAKIISKPILIVILMCSMAIAPAVKTSSSEETVITEEKINTSATAGVMTAIEDMQSHANYVAATKNLETAATNLSQYATEEIKVSENGSLIAMGYSGAVPVGAPGCDADKFTYEPVRLITCKSAPSYKVTHDEGVYVDSSTGVLMNDGKYLIAIGTGYGFDCGEAVTLYMDDGQMVDCIVGDFKADCDTDASNKFHNQDGSVVELIIDDSYTYHKPDCFNSKVCDIVAFID